MKSIYVVLCLVILPTVCSASDASRSKGDKAISFSFNGFEVDEYKYGIGGKYWKNNHIAFTGSLDYEKSDMESTADFGITTLNSNIKQDYYGVSLGIENHFQSKSKLSPYTGAEIFYYTSDSELSTGYKTDYKSYGINALIGFEYFITQEISLGAEYNFEYRKSDTVATYPTYQETTKDDGFSLGAGSLILSVYY